MKYKQQSRSVDYETKSIQTYMAHMHACSSYLIKYTVTFVEKENT